MRERSKSGAERSQAETVLRRLQSEARRQCGRSAWGFLVPLALWCAGMTAAGYDPRTLDVQKATQR